MSLLDTSLCDWSNTTFFKWYILRHISDRITLHLSICKTLNTQVNWTSFAQSEFKLMWLSSATMIRDMNIVKYKCSLQIKNKQQWVESISGTIFLVYFYCTNAVNFQVETHDLAWLIPSKIQSIFYLLFSPLYKPIIMQPKMILITSCPFFWSQFLLTLRYVISSWQLNHPFRLVVSIFEF